MPCSDADRNLLFGFLALQMNLATRESLIAAMSAWVLDRSQEIGAILRSQGAIDDGELSLLEGLVAAHIRRHGGDAEKGLAALGPIVSTAWAPNPVGDAGPDASLERIDLASTEDDPYRTAPYVPDSMPEAPRRFHFLRPHRKGGLGIVSIALDGELNREVAFKEIRDEYADDPRSRSRFLVEAEITGGLEHPGIVPVYGMGYQPDGRPYYAMRLIRGESLKEAIARHRDADRPGVDPADRVLGFRKLLRRFLDACNAIDYAHSRGVLHRDLKPENIMLGPHGETLVVDWGLAKAIGLDQSDADFGPGPLRPSTDPAGHATVPGQAIGTPAYMSPEQAAGDLRGLGPATDIYSLGATLYVLLTGRAPIAKGDGKAATDEILRKVIAGDFPPPHSVDPSVPPGLEAICLKAMALRAEDRHASARDLAEAIERWLAEEPVAAYRQAVDRYEKLVELDPDRPNHREGRARSRVDLGLAFHVLGRSEDASALHREAIADYLALASDFPRVTGYREGLANAYSNLGRILMAMGREPEAKVAYRSCFAEYQQLVRDAPQALDYRTNLGDLLVSLGRMGDEIMETLDRFPPSDAGPEQVDEDSTLPDAIPGEGGTGVSRSPDDPAVGFGDRYDQIRVVGRGGLGRVFLVHDRSLNRDVILKLLIRHQAQDDRARRWFLREAQITASMSHPNIVPIYDVGSAASGQPYYTMMHVTGRTFMEILRNLPSHETPDPTAFRRALEVFLEVCSAIDHAHSRGLLHRDLKPANILIDEKGRPYVVDWGLAKLVGQSGNDGGFLPTDDDDSLTTQVGTVVGTPAYMAPEQAMGDRGEVDVRSDVYGLGAILFQILTGRPPLETRGGVSQALHQLINGEVPDARVIAPWIPRELGAICSKAMAFAKDDRYQGAAYLAEDVRAWLARNPDGHGLARPWYRRLTRLF